jgi:hypothetical protein
MRSNEGAIALIRRELHFGRGMVGPFDNPSMEIEVWDTTDWH